MRNVEMACPEGRAPILFYTVLVKERHLACPIPRIFTNKLGVCVSLEELSVLVPQLSRIVS